MDRKSVIGLVLIALVIIVFSYMNRPSQADIQAQQKYDDSVQRAQDSVTNLTRKIATEKALTIDTLDKSETAVLLKGDATVKLSHTDSLKADSLRALKTRKDLANTYGDFSNAAEGKEQEYILENELIKVHLNAKGGAVTSVELKNFRTYTDYQSNKKAPLLLFDGDSSSFAVNFTYPRMEDSVMALKILSTRSLFFTSENPTVQSVTGKKSAQLIMSLNGNKPGDRVDFIYSLKGNTYDVGFEIKVNGFKNIPLTEEMEIEWRMRPLLSEKLADAERNVCTIFYKYQDEDHDFLSEMSSDETKLESPTTWVAYKTAYFSSILMCDKSFRREGSDIEINTVISDRYTKEYISHLNIASDRGKKDIHPMHFYFGPNDHEILSEYDNGTERIINLGWWIFGAVNRYLVIPVFNLLESFDMGYGMIILVLTLIVKILIFPLTYRNYKSSAKMRILKPEITEIGKKFADEPMKKQQATMALYRSSGVSPLAGCIPIIIQMPVLIAVFRFFPAAIELRQESFLWAEDLSAYDSILKLGFYIPAYGDHVSLFTILMCVSTILLTYVNSGQMDTSAMPGMKVMMYIFPVMMLFFFNKMASGLSYYYFISNVMGMLMMWLVKKYMINEDALRAKIALNRAKPESQKKSKFQQRLEDMQKQRQQQGKKKK
ncbi:MAG: membrane protein insertase YidC [Flavobacteriales bacterium]